MSGHEGSNDRDETMFMSFAIPDHESTRATDETLTELEDKSGFLASPEKSRGEGASAICARVGDEKRKVME